MKKICREGIKIRQGIITKSTDQTEQDLKKINCYTRRNLTAEDVYCFNVILCDNEVDRDYECFTVEALNRLSDLFLGKTGIFDHDPKGKNQTARIYDTQVLEDSFRKTQYGKPYTYLQAKAYMVRNERNADLIKEIDAGIKKEVSVGCSVSQVKCSVCGTNLREQFCEHTKGVKYNNQLCYVVLDDPTDAYEWSFVAVPAQKNAGVIKGYQKKEAENSAMSKPYCSDRERNGEELIKLFEITERSILISKNEAHCLKDEINRLKEQAALGNEYLFKLRKRVKRLGYLDSPQLSSAVIDSVVEKMSVSELRAYEKLYENRLGKGGVQLCEQHKTKETQNTEFKI